MITTRSTPPPPPPSPPPALHSKFIFRHQSEQETWHMTRSTSLPLHPLPPPSLPFDSKFYFPGKFWINLMNFEYHIYPKYSHPCCLPYISLQQVILLPVSLSKIAEWVANTVDPDQTPRFAASDLGLHCLLRSVRMHRVSAVILSTRCPSEINFDPPPPHPLHEKKAKWAAVQRVTTM